MSALLGTGTGAFRPPVNTIVSPSPVAVTVGDFNRDGRPDAATAGGDTVSVLLNDGDWAGLGAPSLAINSATVTEGNAGTTAATFTVTLSFASTQSVTVRYATADSTATAGGDYQPASGTLTFAPGQTTKTVTVLVNGDRSGEFNESFRLDLTNPADAFLTDWSGTGGIVDDEPRLAIDAGPFYVSEGNTGTTTAVFTVRLTNAYDVPVGVNYSTAEGDTEWWTAGHYEEPPRATAGTDFQTDAGTLVFAPGETVKTIGVVVNGDRLGEDSEYFSVNLGYSPAARIDRHHAVGIILDDEPRVTIGDAIAAEGNTGTTAMTFPVYLTSAYDQPVTVTYATSDSDARAGSDYQAASGTVTFAPGETGKSITVQVIGDRLGESSEYFIVTLSGPVNATLDPGYSVAWGTILDNEPRISITGASLKEGNSGTKLMTFTVTLSAAYDQAVTVRYATEDGDARAGEDYVATSGALTFAPGQTTRTFTVKIKGDTKKEYDEQFYVFLSGNSSNSLIEQEYGYGSILDDDRRR